MTMYTATDGMCQKKKEQEDSSARKIVWMQRFKDSKKSKKSFITKVNKF